MARGESGTGTVSRLSSEVASVGGHFALVPDMSAVTEYVTKLAVNTGAKRIVVCGRGLSAALSQPESDMKFVDVASQMTTTREDFYKALVVADIGVSPVDLAVADTGTLITVTSDESDRLVSALPKTHVAVLERSRIVNSLDEAASYLSEILVGNAGGVAVSLISASSRTSDIGGVVIMGVHGPKELHVLVLDQERQGGT